MDHHLFLSCLDVLYPCASRSVLRASGVEVLFEGLISFHLGGDRFVALHFGNDGTITNELPATILLRQKNGKSELIINVGEHCYGVDVSRIAKLQLRPPIDECRLYISSPQKREPPAMRPSVRIVFNSGFDIQYYCSKDVSWMDSYETLTQSIRKLQETFADPSVLVEPPKNKDYRDNEEIRFIDESSSLSSPEKLQEQLNQQYAGLFSHLSRTGLLPTLQNDKISTELNDFAKAFLKFNETRVEMKKVPPIVSKQSASLTEELLDVIFKQEDLQGPISPETVASVMGQLQQLNEEEKQNYEQEVHAELSQL